MRTHQILVTVRRDSIEVSPDTLTMTAKDEVQWAGADAQRFSLEFESDAPFGRRGIAHDEAARGQTPLAKGRFKYTVIAEANPGLRLDPVIIVEEPPTGSNP